MAKHGAARSGGRGLLSAENRHCAEAGAVLGESGTVLANYTYTPSCGVAVDLAGGASSWGGARNRADRVSWHLSERQVYGMIAAAAHAQKIGLAFNRHWIVHYERAGIAEGDGTRFVGHLLRLASAYARRAKGEAAAVWVRENGEGKGGHVHILLHLPFGLTLRNRTRRWIVAAGGAVRGRVSRVFSIGGRLVCAKVGGAHFQQNTDNLVAYLAKGDSREAGLALGLRRSGEGGLVIGKRVGWTQNLGVAARQSLG